MVGLISFGVDFGVYLILLTWLQYIVASSISFALSLVLNYALTLRFVFRPTGRRNVAKEFASFVGLNIIALGLNQLILFLAVDVGGASEAAGKVLATAVVLVYNFISRKLLIERPQSREPAHSTRRSSRGAAADHRTGDPLMSSPAAPVQSVQSHS